MFGLRALFNSYMHKKLYAIVTVILSCFLSGCSLLWDLDTLKKTPPPENAFDRALMEEYLAFSKEEAKKYDWIDSAHFADKGLKVAYGQAVTPEKPSEWNIPDSYLPALEKSRNDLLIALTHEKKINAPIMAAKALFLYDCWVEEQEENWQRSDIASCRDGFYEALHMLTQSPSTGYKPSLSKMPVNNTVKKEVYSYVIFFEGNVPSKETHAVLKNIIEEVPHASSYKLTMHSSKIKPGSREYNLGVEQKRLHIVKKELMKLGVKEEKIELPGHPPLQFDTHGKIHKIVEIVIG